MSTAVSNVVVLGTGGTIAGRAARATDNIGYVAGQVGVQQLVEAVPALAGVPLETEQIAQLDSKDMSDEVWWTLAGRAQAHLDRDGVAGLVVTHGTDTLEETAWLLHRVLCTGKPVVLTAAMRPATSLQADGPQNLLDAVTVARAGEAGVCAVIAGTVWAGADLRKLDSTRLDAFGSWGPGPLGRLEDGCLRRFRPWPGAASRAFALPPPPWPWVEIVSSQAGASARAIDALVAAGVQGLVVAATGNGTVHQAVGEAAARAANAGVRVCRATRCATGGIVGVAAPGALPSAAHLTPAQARLELVLRLLGLPEQL